MKLRAKTKYGYYGPKPPTPGGIAGFLYTQDPADAIEFEVTDFGGWPGPAPEPPPPPIPEPPPPPISEPSPTPLPGVDAVNVASLVITRESPDIRAWPATARMTHLSLSDTDHSDVNFTRRNGPNAWPFVYKPGAYDTGIQYTLWIGYRIGGQWYVTGGIQCISRGEGDNYCKTGPVLRPGHLASNWHWYAGEPLASYQPAPGEQVIFFVTAGSQRREDNHVVAERSNIVMVPFSPGSWDW